MEEFLLKILKWQPDSFLDDNWKNAKYTCITLQRFVAVFRGGGGGGIVSATNLDSKFILYLILLPFPTIWYF